MCLLQVNIGIRVLTRPTPAKLPEIYRTLGTDYGERVLPSIIQVRSRMCWSMLLSLRPLTAGAQEAPARFIWSQAKPLI